MIIALPSYADVFNQTSADKGREVMDRYYYSNEYQEELSKWIYNESFYPMPASGGKKVLNVSNFKQTNTSGCGPACIYQIGKYLGFSNMESLSSLTDRLTQNNTSGTDLQADLINYLNANLGRKEYYMLNTSNVGFYSRLVSSINKNRPVICHVKPNALPNNSYEGDGHYVVSIGYDWYEQGSSGYSKVTYNDPHFNTKIYGTYTCDSDVMTKAINARYGYYAAA